MCLWSEWKQVNNFLLKTERHKLFLKTVQCYIISSLLFFQSKKIISWAHGHQAYKYIPQAYLLPVVVMVLSYCQLDAAGRQMKHLLFKLLKGEASHPCPTSFILLFDYWTLWRAILSHVDKGNTLGLVEPQGRRSLDPWTSSCSRVTMPPSSLDCLPPDYRVKEK